MLKFNGKWRFKPPTDGKWRNQTIPSGAVSDFIDLILKTATQGNRWEILEHFKSAFSPIAGIQSVWSSTESWAETDLNNCMDLSTNNAPLFLEAFYDACVTLSERNVDIVTPDAEIINAICVKNEIGYELQPPNLILRELEMPRLKTGQGEVQQISDLLTGTSPLLLPLCVFLCHSSGDKPMVRELYHRLLKDGVNPWFDEVNLLPGQDWQIEIPKAVRKSDIVIICLSKGSVNKSGYVQKEIKQALDAADEQPDGSIFLIPLKLEECEVPDRLQRWQWVNLFNENGYKNLMRSLKSRAISINKKEPN